MEDIALNKCVPGNLRNSNFEIQGLIDGLLNRLPLEKEDIRA